jgi:riboflavin kinase/FMN adenylyltransferase
MRTIVGRALLEPPPEGAAIAIGTFDGVHLGHRALIAGAIESARRAGTEAIALTWDRHPSVTLRPDRVPPLLSSSDRKAELLRATGIDLLAVVAFDEEFSHLSPEEFVSSVLIEGLDARTVHVGHDWRFGHKAAGDVELLHKLGRDDGFDVFGVDLQEVSGQAVTSSRIRAAIGDGDVKLARTLLGRPYDVDGMVVAGESRGKTLGYPTANLDIDPSLARPPIGIYAGVAQVAGLARPAAISVGTNPTFETAGRVRVEAYLLDFAQEIYDERIRLEFWKRLRGEQRFDSSEELVEQMKRDVEATRAAVGNNR